MLKYILVHRKCNLDIPISTFKCPLVTGFTVPVIREFSMSCLWINVNPASCIFQGQGCVSERFRKSATCLTGHVSSS